MFEFNANGASPAGISENLWRLPGLTVQVTSSVPLAGTEQSGSLLRVLYPLNAGQEANILLIASNE